MSMSPGTTYKPVASATRLARDASIFADTSAILPPAIATSITASIAFLGSITCPPRMSRSNFSCWAEAGGTPTRSAIRTAPNTFAVVIILLSVVRIRSRLRRVGVAQAFAVPHDFAVADGEHRAEAAVALQPAVTGVEEAKASRLQLDDRDVGEPTFAERRQVRALDRTRWAHSHPLHQLLNRNPYVQKLGKRRHHVGTR